MAERKNSNLTGASEIIGPYIHSNVSLFFQNMGNDSSVLDPNNIEVGFYSIIENAKKTLINEVKEHINFLLGLETKLVNSIKEKNKANNKEVNFSDRESFLKYLNTISNSLKETKDLQALIGIKKGMEPARERFNALLKKIGEAVAQPLTKDEIAAIAKNDKKQTLTAEENRRFLRAQAKQSLEAQNKAGFKKLQAEVKKILDEEKKFFKQHQEDMVVYYQNLIKYANSVVDGFKIKENNKEEVNNTINNAAKTILETAKFLGIKTVNNNSSKKELKKFRQDVLNVDPIKFLNIFYSNAASNFVQFQMDAFQMETRLGQIFEQALHDAVVNYVKNNPGMEMIFNDIDLQGQIAWLTHYTAMDLKVSSFKEDTTTINIGFSIKLKKESTGDIKLNIPSDRFDLIMKQRDKLMGPTQKNNLDYVTNNLLTLSIYRADKEGTSFFSKSLDTETEEALALHRSIAQILVLSRVLLGFWNKVSDKQFNMAVGLSDDQTSELFYAAYLFDSTGIYSFASIFNNLLNKVDFTDKEKMKSIVNPRFNETSPFGRVSESTLEDLYKRKQEALKKLSDIGSITYNDIYSDSGVGQVIEKINSAFATGFIKSAAPEVKIKNIKDI